MENTIVQIDNPPHYEQASPLGQLLLMRGLDLTQAELNMKCIDYLEANPLLCGFHLGNAIKYLWRCGEKDDVVTDCQKALWYLRRWERLDLNHADGIKKAVATLVVQVEQAIRVQALCKGEMHGT